jgi:hypothetical protein
MPVQEAVERYVIPAPYKNYRRFSRSFPIGRTYEQLYDEWSRKPVNVLNYT